MILALRISVLALFSFRYPVGHSCPLLFQKYLLMVQRSIIFASTIRHFPMVSEASPASSILEPDRLSSNSQHLIFHLPSSSLRTPAGFPLVLYIHGGGWLAGNARRSVPLDDFPGVLASLSSRGYVVASIEYRLSGEAKFPAQVEDVKASIRWLRLHASTYDIDPSRFMTWGVSAGGYLSGLVATSCNQSAPGEGKREHSSIPDATTASVPSSGPSACVQGAVSWYGIFDFATIADQAQQDKAMSREDPNAPEWQLLGCYGNSKCDPGKIAAASPVTYVDRNDPPMLLIVGSEDKLSHINKQQRWLKNWKAAGAQVELIVFTGLEPQLHREDPGADAGREPQSAGGYVPLHR